MGTAALPTDMPGGPPTTTLYRAWVEHGRCVIGWVGGAGGYFTMVTSQSARHARSCPLDM